MSEEKEDNLPAVRPITEKKFVSATIVRMDDGTRVSVPTSVDANRARNQIIAAVTTELFTKQIKELTSAKADGLTMKPKELGEIIAAAKKLQELNDAAFGVGLPPAAGGDTLTGLGRLVAGAVEAGANAAKGTQSNLVDEMKKLNELGKKSAIDIEEVK